MAKITITVEDSSVGKDGLFYAGLDLSGCGVPANVWALQWSGDAGHIEFNGTEQNESIDTLPSWANSCLQKWEEQDASEKNPPELTGQALIDNNEAVAKYNLSQSDWTQLADVGLANKSEWDAYRAALRAIATSPSESPSWPTKPAVLWA